MAIFPQLFESVPDALIVVDGEGRIVLANGNAERLFGYPPQGLVGLAIEDLVPEDARQRHRAHRGHYMQSPRVRPMGGLNMQLAGQRRDGQQFPVEIALSPLETGEGVHYLASVRDISETQRARQALVRARYDAVVAHIGQLALASTADDGVIARLPALLAEVLEIPVVAVALLRGNQAEVRAAVGMATQDPDDPLWQALAGGALRLALARERPLVVQQAGEVDTPPGWPADMPSGAIVPLLDRDRPMGALFALAAQPRRFDHDALQLLQTVANLIAALVQRRRTEEQLAHAQRLDAIGQMTGGVAHDFNNLLTVMSGSLQLLDAEYADRPGAREIIASALRSVERGAELTAKLLAFARRQRLSPRALDPAAMLADLERLLRGTLGDRVRLRIECPSGLPAVFADPSQLDSALVNLALNARDAMPDGGEIRIGAAERWVTADPTRPEQRPGHYVTFTVADTGHGMTPEVRARAFEPFFTTKAMGRGSGLGLSMVYGFVRQSGGHLQIDSQPGHGTRIELFLPVATGEATPSPTPGRTEDSRGAETVLVVEDEAEVRNIAAAFLHSLGYHVIAVGSAADALEHLAANDGIALLFSDVMLGGGMNGVELAQAARALRPRLGVLLTSGYDAPAADAAGQFELLRKPYRREQLAAAVRRTLAG
ncbi:PAS domain S-box protein [Vulcaniibacterium gelatinicum]|uniref:PAS domain S-box protein n=1 Tax=Vulcaniibacterium gelatinicum TaxID=2598725 RepID=UPI0011CB5C8B|nr:PAS domain S-box protein [Vulcaniibacterium gelatinicum]